MAQETVLITAGDGVALAADVSLPTHRRAAAVLLHPHPLYGGDRRNAVVDALFRALPEAGVATVRFDFRGAGESGGTHDDGDAERLDAVAALDLVAPYATDGPLVLVGYSFGALVALGVTDPRLDGWVAVAPPLAVTSRPLLAGPDHRPKLLAVPEHDQFTAPAAARAVAGAWPNTEVVDIPMADHFLAGALATVVDLTLAFVDRLAG